jgi:hypothetical protein
MDHRRIVPAGGTRLAEQISGFRDPVGAEGCFGLLEQRVGVHGLIVARPRASV